MKYLLITGLLVFCLACKKAEDRTCVKGAGDTTELIIDLESFDKLYLGPHLNYVLLQDTIDQLVIKGGENLVKHVGMEIVNGRLSLHNNNKCSYLRSYNKTLTVEIHFKEVFNIEFNGTMTTECPDTLRTDFLSLTMMESAGELNVLAKSKVMNVTVNKNWGNFVLNGQTDYLKMNISANGFGTTYGLNVEDSIYIISKSAEVVKINADNVLLRSQTKSFGDIWYIGTPTSIDHQTSSEGQLLNKN